VERTHAARAATRWLVATMSAVALLGAAAHARADVSSPWAAEQNWISVRAGYAKASVKAAADGLGGFGFGFNHFRNSKWAFGAYAHYEVLGRFGPAQEIEVPLTAEVTRHFKWTTPARPYLGLGTGAFFHKTYRTGDDGSDTRTGYYVVGGMNAPISDHSLFGLDLRAIVETSARSTNPVFPNSSANAIHWSVKLDYSRHE